MTERLKVEAMEAHAPQAHAKISNAVGAGDMAERCRRTARRVHQSFYSPAVADQAKKRVAL